MADPYEPKPKDPTWKEPQAQPVSNLLGKQATDSKADYLLGKQSSPQNAPASPGVEPTPTTSAEPWTPVSFDNLSTRGKPNQIPVTPSATDTNPAEPWTPVSFDNSTRGGGSTSADPEPKPNLEPLHLQNIESPREPELAPSGTMIMPPEILTKPKASTLAGIALAAAMMTGGEPKSDRNDEDHKPIDTRFIEENIPGLVVPVSSHMEPEVSVSPDAVATFRDIPTPSPTPKPSPFATSELKPNREPSPFATSEPTGQWLPPLEPIHVDQAEIVPKPLQTIASPTPAATEQPGVITSTALDQQPAPAAPPAREASFPGTSQVEAQMQTGDLPAQEMPFPAGPSASQPLRPQMNYGDLPAQEMPFPTAEQPTPTPKTPAAAAPASPVPGVDGQPLNIVTPAPTHPRWQFWKK